MTTYGDMRNALDVELARASGGYLDSVPEDWFGNPRIVLERKFDGIRLSLQGDDEKNWAISRNREDKLKGVDAAGLFCEKSDKLPHLCRDLELPGGAMLDGELVCGDDERGRGASVSHYMKECPEKLIYCAFDLIFDIGGVDLRKKSFEFRRSRMLKLVDALGSPFVKASEILPSTMAEVEKLWAAGWEGGILKDLDVAYRGKRAMKKIKSENPLDAFCIEPVIERKGGSPKNGIKPEPTGRASGFVMGMRTRDGKTVKVGTMMMDVPDHDKERGVKFFDREYLGKVAAATASGFNGKEFRWMKWKAWRTEEGGIKKCVFEEQVGEREIETSDV